MKINKKFLSCITAAALLGTAACGDDEPEPEPTPQGFPQPANTVPLNFTIDASGRPGFYADEGLEWKGAFTYDKTTRMLTYASDWAGGKGPYAPLYDDGPWDQGGHEPKGAVKGDNKFGITAFLPVPTEELKIGYGAQIPLGPNCSDTAAGGCWIWTGSDGSVTVPAGATDAVTAEGLKLSPEGNTDLRFTLNTANLGSGFVLGAGQTVKVKGSYAGWDPDLAYDDGTHGDATPNDKIYTYTLSANTPRRLKVATGANVEFIWMVNEVDYKKGSEGETTGVEAFTKGPSDANFVKRTVEILPANGNTYVKIP